MREEFVTLLDQLLTCDVTSYEGEFYAAHQVRDVPGCVQRPRLPFAVAATGPRGMRLAARHGQAWVTYGDARGPAEVPVEDSPGVIRDQLDRLEAACIDQDADPAALEQILLQGSTRERPLESVAAFVDYAGRHAALGITEIVLHWPIPSSVHDADQSVFERIATEGMAQLDG